MIRDVQVTQVPRQNGAGQRLSWLRRGLAKISMMCQSLSRWDLP